MLDVEAALARACAQAGLIGAESAERIAAACVARDFDVVALGRQAAHHATPVVGLVAALRNAVGEPVRRRRAPRRDQPGHPRHGADAGRAARADAAARRPVAGRGRGRRARRYAPAHPDGRANAAPAGAADHVRAAGRDLARGSRRRSPAAQAAARRRARGADGRSRRRPLAGGRRARGDAAGARRAGPAVAHGQDARRRRWRRRSGRWRACCRRSPAT